MKLLLQRNVDKLGKIGDIVEVAAGYGRNYLLPQGLAVELTKDNIHRFESMKRRLLAIERETKEKYMVLAKEIEKASCTIIANSSEEGHLYGSVTARDIAQQFANDGLQVDPKWVLLEHPIKELGIYKVHIRLHPDVECEAKVWVVKGGDEGTSRKSPEVAEEESEPLGEDSTQEETTEKAATEGGA